MKAHFMSNTVLCDKRRLTFVSSYCVCRHGRTEALPRTCGWRRWTLGGRRRCVWLRSFRSEDACCGCGWKVQMLACPQPSVNSRWLSDQRWNFTVRLSAGVPKPLSECIVDVDSMEIFPVGWCEANSYPLTSPLKPVCTSTQTLAGSSRETETEPHLSLCLQAGSRSRSQLCSQKNSKMSSRLSGVQNVVLFLYERKKRHRHKKLKNNIPNYCLYDIYFTKMQSHKQTKL